MSAMPIAVGAERHCRRFEAQPCPGTGLEEQQGHRPSYPKPSRVRVLDWKNKSATVRPANLKHGSALFFEFVSDLTKFVNVVDVQFTRTQNVLEMAGLSRSDIRPAGSLVEFCRAARRIYTPYRNASSDLLTKC